MTCEVHIVGVGTTRLGKRPEVSVKSLAAEAVHAAMVDAGCIAKDIQAAWFCNTRWGIFEGQHGIRGQTALRPLGLHAIPIFNTDNACASSTAGLSLARQWIRSGASDTALVVGAEKMIYEGRRAEMFQAFKGSMDLEHAEAQLARLVDLSRSLMAPGQGPETERSIFMDSYAAHARIHMARYGTTAAQLAYAASKNHRNSQFNPNAQYQRSMSVEEILSDKMIAWPLTRSMCAPMTDGAGAVILCSDRVLPRFDSRRAVRILACQITTGAPREPLDSSNQVGRLAAQRAYEEAGVGAEDISVAEVHDASAFGELKQVENMGFCGIGESGPFTERGNTELGGKIPINPSGGLLSKGHPVGATGAIQIHELVTQLRGEAGRRQVPAARIAAAENGGGFYDGEEAVAAVTILAR